MIKLSVEDASAQGFKGGVAGIFFLINSCIQPLLIAGTSIILFLATPITLP